MKLRLPSPGRRKFDSGSIDPRSSDQSIRLRGFLRPVAIRQNKDDHSMYRYDLPNVVAESVLHVHETSVAAFGNLVDSLEVGVGELDALEVAVDS